MPEPEDSKDPLESAVTTLGGVGAERARQLARLGIRTVGDFLLHRPRRYEDRRHLRAIGDVREKGLATVRGRVVACGVKYFRRRTRSVFEVILDDGTGRLHCRWWNMAYLEERFAVGMQLLAHGRVVELRPRTLEHPEVEVEAEEVGEEAGGGEEARVPMNRIVPVYPLTEGLTQRWMRARLWALLEVAAGWIEEPWPPVRRGGMPSRAEAVRWLHFPPEVEDAERARRRLAFDEFTALQGEIQERRRRLHARAVGLPCGGDNRWMRPFLGGLGFALTAGQTRVLRDIRRDLESGRPMRRLVQGDVGCGKTVVAAAAAVMALESGFEVALMAPTEILARQHWERLKGWLGSLGIAVDLRTGPVKVDAGEGRGRGESGAGAGAGGGAVLTVGTHALLTGGFAPGRLGLVIIDEQHKFGVVQREALVRKGAYPHLLVMTATPIPRTLALTLYGDLDVSVIDESPPGRGRVRTFVRGRSSVPKVMGFVREQLGAGHRAFVVYPRVDDDESGMVKAVVRERERWASALAPFPVGMVHGRLPADERERVMEAFRGGELRVLLATQIVEVGVDIPEATVMVIENAERFGLAQLHQLRGRIGRGGRDGYCILVAGHEEEEGMARLRVLERSTDGFAIAEADLRMRGPGDLLGQAQSGVPPLRFGDLAGDRELLEAARLAVSEWLAERAGEGEGVGVGGREAGRAFGDATHLVPREKSR